MKQYINDFQSFMVDDAIKTYESYLQKNYKVEIVHALIESKTLNDEASFVLEAVVENNLYDSLWDGSINESIMDESLRSWFEDKYEKAKEFVQDTKQAGAEKLTQAKKWALDKAQKTMAMFKSIGDWVGKILDAVKTGLQKLWKAVYAGVEKKFSGNANQAAVGISNKLAKDPEQSKEEIKNLGQMAVGGVKLATGGIVDRFKEGINKAVDEDTNESNIHFFYDVLIHEAAYQIIRKHGIDFINEAEEANRLFENESLLEGGGESSSTLAKIPGLSKLKAAMSELPIIKQLADIEHAAAKVANTLLTKTSVILNKLGAAGGPYKFAILGGIVGLGVEYYAKYKVKSALGLHESDETDELIRSINEEMEIMNEGEGEGKSMKQYLIGAGVSIVILTICIAIPGFGVVFSIMKKVATCLWWYNVISIALTLLEQLLKKKKDGDKAELSPEDIEKTIKKGKEENDKKQEDAIEKGKDEADEETIMKGGKDLGDDDEDEDKDKDKK
jgi:hypothetical protein